MRAGVGPSRNCPLALDSFRALNVEFRFLTQGYAEVH